MLLQRILPNMHPFATEFPVKPIGHRAAFVAQVIAWLRGTRYSTVLSTDAEAALDKEDALLLSGAGEELHLRDLSDAVSFEAVGFRHDMPDNAGRLWRTEAVLRRKAANNGQDLLRLRTQCLARKAGALLETPRKPYLIRTMLKDDWGGEDGSLAISDQAIWLDSSASALDAARAVSLGEATKWLPIVYVSATTEGGWILSERQIELLAYDLGGVAHVVVEPDREFSFRLREQSGGSNCYGGTIGIGLPGRGLIRRFFLGLRFQEAGDLLAAVRSAVTSVRSQMPVFGWDWTDLQERALRAQRSRYKNLLSAQESEELYQKEIDNLRDKIQQLEDQIATRPIGNKELEDEGLGGLKSVLGPEIYPDEIADRLRLAVRIALSSADQNGLDARSKIVFEKFLTNIPLSSGYEQLSADLDRAVSRKSQLDFVLLLTRYGFIEKSANKHIKLEAGDGYEGIGPVTISKTHSDYRAAKNLRSQIKKCLGLTGF